MARVRGTWAVGVAVRGGGSHAGAWRIGYIVECTGSYGGEMGHRADRKWFVFVAWRGVAYHRGTGRIVNISWS